MPETHTGGCYCGAMEIEVRGEPLEMGYCHCENCRRYSAAPVSAFTLWKKDNVRLTKGAEFLGRFKSSDISGPPVLHKVRRSHRGRSSDSRLDRCTTQCAPELSVQANGALELCRNRSSNERWTAEA